MSKIVKLPVVKLPEPSENEIGDIDIPEIDDIDFEIMYAQDEHYISKDKCYKCGKNLNINDNSEHVWYIDQLAGYPSDIDGSQVSIVICDDCLMKFLKE